MARINKTKLSKEATACLLQRLDTLLAKHDRRKVGMFLEELLGKEERLMIAKRLAAIVLLHDGYSAYKTARALKLSQSTVGALAHKLETGGFSHTLHLFSTHKNDYRTIAKTIDSILTVGGLMPHRTGLDRYRSLKYYSSKR